jgi:hypothetical protein
MVFEISHELPIPNVIMRIRIIIIVVLFFILPDIAISQSAANRKVYRPGETLRFQLYYGLINAGEVEMSLTPARLDGKQVLHAVATGFTTGLADRLFKVYDVYESYMNPDTGLPYKAIRNISEGRYRYYNEVLYDRKNNTVESQRSGTHEVPSGILDIISGIYKLRDTMQTMAFRGGEVLELTTFFSDEVYPMVVRYQGTETIRTRKGTFHALKFAPVSEPGRLFKSEDDITVWFSNDRNYVPLRISLNMIVGSVRVDLIEARGLRYDLIDVR